ncbi:HtaA domain-containing protein [Corynebacterium argentoratense]|uniref:HtaA domain-containing protein n=1 Tax=Corynebacterium argentoratense TaxID=42817 RepID=UPI003C701E5B
MKKFALLTGLSLALTTGAPLLAPTVIMPAAYADQTETIGITPTDGVNQEYDADHLALEWGIRSSFNNYVGGSTHIFDGAKASGKSYLWPYLGTDKNEDGSVSINYGGTVNFMKYCTDPEDPQRGACQLDLTLSNPTIKTVPGTGKGMLSVVVHTIDYATKTTPLSSGVARSALTSRWWILTPVDSTRARLPTLSSGRSPRGAVWRVH